MLIQRNLVWWWSTSSMSLHAIHALHARRRFT